MLDTSLEYNEFEIAGNEEGPQGSYVFLCELCVSEGGKKKKKCCKKYKKGKRCKSCPKG